MCEKSKQRIDIARIQCALTNFVNIEFTFENTKYKGGQMFLLLNGALCIVAKCILFHILKIFLTPY